MSAGDWCLIESDPGVFSELIRGFGVTGIQVEEIYSLDNEYFSNLRPVHGLIFLFKYTEKAGATKDKVVQNDEIFFAKQVINNACATQAILAVLMNTKDKDVKLGKTLSDLKEFTQGFDSSMKGLAISNSEVIRDVHNSFSRQQIVEFDQKSAKQDDDVFHFVSYIPVNGKVYELDGLRDGPIEHCTIPSGADWEAFARPVIESRIAQYSSGEIHFNLMAVVSDRRMILQQNMDALRLEVTAGKKTNLEIQPDLNRLAMSVDHEELKIKRYKQENVRRRHNYLPLIMEILKILAEKQKLIPIVEKALSLIHI